MNTAEDVSKLIEQLKNQGIPLADAAWQTALACVGWAYVFGAAGQYCDPVNRRAFYKSHGNDHPTIKSKCCNFNGSDKVVGACSKCKWYPGGRTRFYDCRGFTRWILKQIYGFELQGQGATSQWNTASNWKAKGTIDTMPGNTLVCLFVKKGAKMEHTGFGLNNETIECSNGVEHYTKRNKKWTHWAQPACVEGGVTPTPPGPTPTPTPPSGKAIVTGTMVAIRQGPSTGTAVMTRVKTGEIVDLITVEGWTYVRCGDKYGFMMNEFISINDTSVVVTGKKVALRQGTNTSSKVLDRIKTGTVVPREPLPDGWAYVRYGNKQGFMMKEFIKEG